MRGRIACAKSKDARLASPTRRQHPWRTAAGRNEWQARALAVVNEAGANLTATLDLERLFAQILAEVDRVASSNIATLRVMDPEDRCFRIVADRGFTSFEERRDEERAWDMVGPVVLRTGQSTVRRHFLTHDAEQVSVEQAGHFAKARSAMWLPIIFGSETLGVIGLFRGDHQMFHPEEQAPMTALAKHIANAVANARLHRLLETRLQSKLLHSTLLSEIGQAIASSSGVDPVLKAIVRGVVEAFKAEGSAILLLNDRQDQFFVAAGHGLVEQPVRVPAAGTASGWVVSHGRPFVLATQGSCAFDASRSWQQRHGISCYASAPLIVQGKVIGCLGVWETTREFSENDVALLQDMATQAGLAIEQARLSASLASEKARFEAIVESMQEGLALVDDVGAIVHANRRFVELLSLDVRSAIDHTPIGDIWDRLGARCDAPDAERAKLRALERDGFQSALLSLAQPRRQDIMIQVFAVNSSTTETIGRGYLIRDVTQQAEVERLKSEMLSNVSHELQTPLAVIKGFATSLLRKDVEWDDANERDFIEHIDREADRLSALVRNLLDMSRLEAGTLLLERDWCDLHELVVNVLARMAPVTARHRVDLSSTDANVLVFADGRYLECVARNLIENAAKYSSAGSTITVGLVKRESEVLLTVADQGPGISPKECQHIFERFYRGSGTRSTAGLGLGLAICQGVVEAHGGIITVDSVLGQGSIFSVRLPRPYEEATV